MTSPRSRLVLAAATTAALLATALPATAAAPASAPASGSASQAGSSELDLARAALADVESLLAGAPRAAKAPGASAATTGGRALAPVNATMALRQLALHRDALDGEERRTAEAYLARPTDPGRNEEFGYDVAEAPPVCNADVCVHYVRSTDDAPDLTDADRNGVPDYVDRVFATLTRVHDTYVAAGYRSPKSDGTRGGTPATDVYLADTGASGGLYGFCTSDDRIPPRGPFDVSAYCVIDNDFAASQFGGRNTPTENMQVTVAHEFFHAVQFGYDIKEDLWFLEATAAWVEDELYGDVDDNLQYLASSPLRRPGVPLDTFDQFTLSHYGSWIFFRYLSERFRAEQGGMPTIVRDMFRRADASRGAPDQTSTQAIRSVLRDRKQADFPALFASFAAANRRPGQTYDEGRANSYPAPPLSKRYQLGRSTTRRGSFRADHLTSATVRATPTAQLRGSTPWRLRIALTMAPKARGSAAVATIHQRDGRVRTVRIPVNAAGRATKAVPFSAATVRHVELTMVNASTRYRCFVGGPFSCQGVSRDDDAPVSFRLQVLGRPGS